MNDQNGRSARLRHTATGALAALAVVGAVAGTSALGAGKHAKKPGPAAAANSGATKTPTAPVPGKSRTPRPAVNHQPFFDVVQRLVENGTITATQGQVLDREIQAGRIDTDTLTGFTQTQLQTVEQALANAKRALAPAQVGGAGPAKTGTPGKNPSP